MALRWFRNYCGARFTISSRRTGIGGSAGGRAAEYPVLTEAGQCVPGDPPTLTKVILDSLAFRYASVLKSIQSLTGERIHGVHIVGGGSKNDYLNQATANVTGLPVLAGPVEATVTGNVLAQAIACGRFSSLVEGRAHVAENVRLKRFMPRPTRALEEASRRYAAIESRWIEHEASVVVHHAL